MKVQFDYQHTVDQIKLLADIRFRLLAFVPAFAAAAVVFFSDTKEISEPKEINTALAVGIVGFLVTIGIIFYDIRNTQFYNAAVHRAKWLEALLDLPVCTKDKTVGGLFNERPSDKLKFFGMSEIWHDRGLSLTYGASLGGWTYIVANSSLLSLQFPAYGLALMIAVFTGSLFAWQYERLSGLKRPQPNNELEQEIFRHRKIGSREPTNTQSPGSI